MGYLEGGRLIFRESSGGKITEYRIYPAWFYLGREHRLWLLDAASFEGLNMHVGAQVFHLRGGQFGEPICPDIFGPGDVLKIPAKELGLQFFCFIKVADHEGL